MKAAPMIQKPAFPLMKQGDIRNIYHLKMPCWLFTDERYTGLALVEHPDTRSGSASFVPAGHEEAEDTPEDQAPLPVVQEDGRSAGFAPQ